MAKDECPECGSNFTFRILDPKEQRFYFECRACWHTWWESKTVTPNKTEGQ